MALELAVGREHGQRDLVALVPRPTSAGPLFLRRGFRETPCEVFPSGDRERTASTFRERAIGSCLGIETCVGRSQLRARVGPFRFYQDGEGDARTCAHQPIKSLQPLFDRATLSLPKSKIVKKRRIEPIRCIACLLLYRPDHGRTTGMAILLRLVLPRSRMSLRALTEYICPLAIASCNHSRGSCR